jgi:hypothetical protein
MKPLLKTLGLVTALATYHMIQVSTTNGKLALAYDMGVKDGITIERNNAEVKSRQAENQIIKVKQTRWANGGIR